MKFKTRSIFNLAGVDGNRTHHGPRQPITGFEVQGAHQVHSYPHVPEGNK
jgi:hypothetical protein